jgi:large subunit ribosomal protein L33
VLRRALTGADAARSPRVALRRARASFAEGAELRDTPVKTKERYVFLECTACKNRNYTTFKRQKSGYKLEKNKYCPFCRKHTPHKEHKL